MIGYNNGTIIAILIISAPPLIMNWTVYISPTLTYSYISVYRYYIQLVYYKDIVALVYNSYISTVEIVAYIVKELAMLIF